MISHYGIKSLLDVGCGKGVSTSWFVTHGLEYVQCVEGSHDAVSQSIVPSTTPEENYQRVVEHDFSRGPWWPERTVDAVWCVEFTEHVGRNYQPNYLTAFRKAALIFVTHSNWGGWHHVGRMLFVGLKIFRCVSSFDNSNTHILCSCFNRWKFTMTTGGERVGKQQDWSTLNH